MPTVLILAASPLDQDRLRLNHEVKKIKQALERAQNRENWKIETNEAATVDDLRRHLLDYQPTVVHFCGHGGGEDGLCFEDDAGETHPAHAIPLAKLLHLVKDKLKCVVLNACYSIVQAEAIQQNIDYVAGMKATIGDEAAIKFAVAFYDVVFAGMDFETAFNFGCSAIDLHNLPEADVPVFLTSPQVGGTQLLYTENVPEIENVLHAYLNTPYTERHQFTTKGEALAEVIRQYYADRMLTPVSKVTVVSKRQIDSCHWKVRVRIKAVGGQLYWNYYLRIEDRVIRVDWEATVGYWSKPFKTYLAFGTDEDIVARVSAEIGNSYFGSFSEKGRSFQNVNLHTIDGESLHAYVRRSGPVYKELMGILSDGHSHDITLAIGNINEDTEYPVIGGVLSRTWILSGAEQPGGV